MFGAIGEWSYRRRLVTAIRKHGWTAVGFDGPESWTYSVGFTSTLSAPEIVISGLPPEFENALMWEAFRQLQDGDLVLADKAVWRLDKAKWGLEEDWTPMWREVDPYWIGHGRIHYALWHRDQMTGQRSDVRAFQLVFYDVESGLFPWEEGFPQERRREQVEFYLPAPAQ